MCFGRHPLHTYRVGALPTLGVLAFGRIPFLGVDLRLVPLGPDRDPTSLQLPKGL